MWKPTSSLTCRSKQSLYVFEMPAVGHLCKGEACCRPLAHITWCDMAVQRSIRGRTWPQLHQAGPSTPANRFNRNVPWNVVEMS